MDWPMVLRGIDDVLRSGKGRAEQAIQITELIRQAGSYRWVGLYTVTQREIAAIGWSGPGAPAHPRFPVTQGLSGAAVAGRRAVVSRVRWSRPPQRRSDQALARWPIDCCTSA